LDLARQIWIDHEVDIPVRSALEALITALFIAQKQSTRRARRWAQYADFLKARFLKKYPDLSKKPGAPEGTLGDTAARWKTQETFPQSGLLGVRSP
jgi:hypothetical protein